MRRIISLMDHWIFHGLKGEVEHINLPHTWNAIDGQDGGNNYCRGNFYYEKEFDQITFDPANQQVYLEFEGVNASCDVILNGKKLIHHDGGYSAFRVEITSELSESNQLQVTVDNQTNKKVYPQKADFTFYGGIYRDVKILIVSKYHFDLNYFGSDGVKITPSIMKNQAKVAIEAYTNAKQAVVEIEIHNQDGEIVATSEESKNEIVIENPVLWDGIQNPYLYTAVLRLVIAGQVKDEVRKRFGIRSFLVDPKKGFFLNGRPYPLHGVSRHQDFKGIGNAITKEQHRQDMELIKEIGANTIRLAHYQHDQYFYDLCDEEGMIVWAEIPYISEHMPEGRNNTINQMKELIVQNYHHASIVTWGISNEITISTKNKKDMLENHRLLNDLCHQMDSTRLTTLACYSVCGPFNPVAHITDLVGWNLYLGWYVPGLFLNDWWLRFFHSIYPNRPIGYSEYGAEGMPNLHRAHPHRGDHTEDYQAKYHEYMLNCFERHPYMWSTYVWNMFDFAADARDQGGEAGMNHKGLITFDRRIKKDSFYLYKAWWSEEPFIHLAGKRYEYRTEKVTDIAVYTNQDEVSLYQNGKLIETKKGAHVFHFKVILEKENQIEVKTGEWKDTAMIYKTAQQRSEYKVTKGKSQNWV